MIDRTARDKALAILNTVSSGLTNFALEDSWPKSDSDASLNCILRWLWTTYDDGEEVPMSSVLVGENSEILERTIRFLSSDIEFLERQLTADELKQVRKEWGREWRPGCTLPTYPEWPFPEQSSPKS